ncbi:tyrosine-protein phosphatase [Plantibacter sp. VKM Ac-2880]|uniref:tyrosine-protein phosphatase n=1 Tax=Plantibacter sp. VKM Ac-2880 TaxID=2783827 RepID=UPI001890332D|nr:tyrosine-protein phosphatase [Plantibacter sp. VKM Ac-2880]MBF4569925.1 tyrosine-protein phosphatase [Plantibacter sp. VKM Ac-2880]
MQTIDLDGVYNARVAGSPTAPWLIRSAAPDTLTDAGRATLAELGVRLVVDLRETIERAEDARDAGIPVTSVPVYGTPDGPPSTGSLEAVYETLLTTRGTALAAAVGAIADALDDDRGAVLVHCTAGKDRTGLVVALALLATGTPAEAVVADYATSGESVARHRERLVVATLAELGLDDTALIEARRLHLDSPAEVMRGAVATIDALGGARRYLLDHGLSTDRLGRLDRRVTTAALAERGADA